MTDYVYDRECPFREDGECVYTHCKCSECPIVDELEEVE